MSQEFEAAGLDTAAQAIAAGPAHGHGDAANCANCGTALRGPWCHHCGQAEHDFHRSAWHLLMEFIEGAFHFDGRLWRTLPRLLLRPAELTRDFVDGHRAAQVPPLRMFLVLLLLLFVCGSVSDVKVVTADGGAGAAADLSPQDRKDLEDARAMIGHLKSGQAAGSAQGGARREWFRRHLQPAMDHPAEFRLILEQWSERFAVLMLPIAAGLLKLLFLRRRELWLFDHLIFTMHSLSFQCLLMLAMIATGRLLPGALASALLLIAPVHLFVHMRGFYRLGAFATGWRMALLGVGSAVAVALLSAGLLSLGVSEITEP